MFIIQCWSIHDVGIHAFEHRVVIELIIWQCVYDLIQVLWICEIGVREHLGVLVRVGRWTIRQQSV